MIKSVRAYNAGRNQNDIKKYNKAETKNDPVAEP